MTDTHESHDGTPRDDDAREEDAGSQALEKTVGNWFKEGITDEEDGEGDVVISRSHIQIIFHACETGITDVGSVKKREEVEQR